MNLLDKQKQITAVSALAEGASIRSIERITGIHRDTIMRLGVRVGKACEKILDHKMRGLNCRAIEVDELWGFYPEETGAHVHDRSSDWFWRRVDVSFH